MVGWLECVCKWSTCHYVTVQLQVEEITRRLQTGELGIPPIGERSVSLCVSVRCGQPRYDT